MIRHPASVPRVCDLDDAEQCLRRALMTGPPTGTGNHTVHLLGLGRILELKRQWNEAESCYRRALDLALRSPNTVSDNIWQIALRLIQILEDSDRKMEADALRRRIEVRLLSRKEDPSNLARLRATALDMFLAGQYTEAESIYRHLLTKRHDQASNHCHLARLLLITNRTAEARREVERAWAVCMDSPAHVLVRIEFLRILLDMLDGGNWRPILKSFVRALAQPGAHLDWNMQAVLDHLRSRLGTDEFVLTTLMLDAICQRSKLPELKAHPLWKRIVDGDGTPGAQ